ncbi:MAG: aminotransferase class I/II-fold pyridoxal phosphate-dependent enzyme [Candidatus Sericytochromatia bacterium]|nr:aminotransferase class I/II-fold pyridoxal phosphate-dependent enzyme [Candidatus Sericytochromatia bacterium]
MSKLERLRRPDLVGLRAPTPMAEDLPVRLDGRRTPLDWPEALKRRCVEALASAAWHQAQGAEAALRRLAAERAGLPPSCVALFAQGEAALSALLTTWCWQGRLAYPIPTHPGYAVAAQVLGITPIAVLSHADFSLPVEQLVGVARQHQVQMVLISNPSEPSGTLVTREEILTIARGTDALVVVDERNLALGELSVADAVGEEENLVVLQGLGPSLLVGAWEVAWVLAARSVIAELEKLPGTARLPVTASLGASWTLEHQAELTPPPAELATRREALRLGLAELDGVVTWPSVAHYMLVGTTLPGRDLASLLRDRGIAVQAFDRSPLKTCIRVGLGTPEESTAFLTTMRGVFGRAPGR